VAGKNSKDFEKKKYEQIVCSSYILLAHPLKSRLRRKIEQDKKDVALLLVHGAIIKESSPHPCVHPFQSRGV